MIGAGDGELHLVVQLPATWSDSYGGDQLEIHSVGAIGKSWSRYSFHALAERVQNFQSGEIPVIDPETGTQRFETNAVTIRKLPEAEFSGRDHRLFGRFPLWFSFESTAEPALPLGAGIRAARSSTSFKPTSSRTVCIT